MGNSVGGRVGKITRRRSFENSIGIEVTVCHFQNQKCHFEVFFLLCVLGNLNMNFSMMDSKYKYMKVYILSAPNDLYQFSSSYNFQQMIDICITRNWIGVPGEKLWGCRFCAAGYDVCANTGCFCFANWIYFLTLHPCWRSWNSGGERK